MTPSRLTFALVALLALPAAAAGSAKSVRMWDPSAIATVSGTIESVERVEMGAGWCCVKLRLRTAEGAIQVRVGPEWFLAERRYAFAAGDRVEVKGSRISFGGEPALVAGEVIRGADRIVLRGADGRPAWAAR